MIFESIWKYLRVRWNILKYLKIFEDIWNILRCFQISSNIFKHPRQPCWARKALLRICGDIWKHLKIFRISEDIWGHLWIFWDLWKYLKIAVDIWKYSLKLFEYIQISWDNPAGLVGLSLDIRKEFLKRYLQICSNTFQYPGTTLLGSQCSPQDL